MFVVKRDGRRESVAFDKITRRISKLCYGLDPKYVEPVVIAQKASTSVAIPWLAVTPRLLEQQCQMSPSNRQCWRRNPSTEVKRQACNDCGIDQVYGA